MEEKEQVEKLVEFAREVSKFLHITTPSIRYKEHGGYGSSWYDPETDTVYIGVEARTRDAYYDIAHEVRHKWQWVTDSNFYYSKYKEVGIVSLEEYRSQISEIDADAFAVLMTAIYLNEVVKLNGYSNKEKENIIRRAMKIAKEYNIKFPFEDYCGMMKITL